MEDYSYLDKKYFVDETVYNCPFCNRKNVPYKITAYNVFNWSEKKQCMVYFVECSFCNNKSMHLSYFYLLQKVHTQYGDRVREPYTFEKSTDIDSKIFYSVPTSFFVLDDRIPANIRELITEAEGCLKMNFLTGASVCMRKAIYELLIFEKIEGEDYEARIKSLKIKHPSVDPTYFDTLSHIQDMTSDKVHEQSWDKWESKYLKLIIETLKSILHDIYVLPKVKAQRSSIIQRLREGILKDKKKEDDPA